jgi:hypothetical protein
MKEILGDNLKNFFANIDKYGIESNMTYKGERYEVWEVDDDLFPEMCDMSEEEFIELAGYDAWWRQSEGSILGSPNSTAFVNGHEIFAWIDEEKYNAWCEDCGCDIEEECNECKIKDRTFTSLSEYLCDEMGCSQPKNVCALSVDLARYNKMTLGELFSKLEV